MASVPRPVALLGQVVPNRLAGMAAVFHALGKLANVIEVAPDLHMVIVDIAAGADLLFIPRIVDVHLAAIRNAKHLRRRFAPAGRAVPLFAGTKDPPPV